MTRTCSFTRNSSGVRTDGPLLLTVRGSWLQRLRVSKMKNPDIQNFSIAYTDDPVLVFEGTGKVVFEYGTALALGFEGMDRTNTETHLTGNQFASGLIVEFKSKARIYCANK